MARLRIAKPGGNIDTDLSKDLAFDSDFSCFNVIQETNVQMTTNGSGVGSVTYTHSLGYIPMYQVWIKEKGSVYLNNMWALLSQSASGSIAYATTTTIEIFADFALESTTYDYHIIIFGNTPDNVSASGNNNISGTMKIAKPGVDLETATDIRQLAFQSGKHTLKYDDENSGTTSITVSAGSSNYIDISHNIGYVPLVFVKDVSDTIGGSSTSKMLPVFYEFASNAFYAVDRNKIRVVADAFYYGSSLTYNLKYFTYRDKIA